MVEKAMVAGLLAVFVLTLAKGPLVKTLTSFGPATPVPAVQATGLPTSPAGPAQPSAPGMTALPDSHVTASEPASPAVPRGYTAHNFRDPFENRLPAVRSASPDQHVMMASTIDRPAAGASPQTPVSSSPLEVQGLLWGGPKPKAIINGRVYGVNDTVNGAKIIAINQRGVAIERPDAPVYYSPSSKRQSTKGIFSRKVP